MSKKYKNTVSQSILMIGSGALRGIVEGPRLGMKNVKKHQYLARFEGVADRREAARRLLGRKTVCLVGKGRKIFGRITGLHGRKGTVRVRFRRGLPEPSNGLPLILIESKRRFKT
ncbi:MAG: 50S ribosomal protein L35ae [Candidatus Brockarchaeota archaeon]|nr:50S ribosomal protein L35ae [Candidatus Brockarchaeota archaeon]